MKIHDEKVTTKQNVVMYSWNTVKLLQMHHTTVKISLSKVVGWSLFPRGITASMFLFNLHDGNKLFLLENQGDLWKDTLQFIEQ